MQSSSELKARARELESSDRPGEALAIYLRYVDEADDSVPAIWGRIGDLQLKLGETSLGAQSLRRAIDGFRAAGELNNALVMSHLLLEADPDNRATILQIGELSLELDYRIDAREAFAVYARSTAESGRVNDAVDPFTAFLRRFPDEQELWREWAEELYVTGRGDDAFAALETISDRLSHLGLVAAARMIIAEATALADGEASIDDDLEPPASAPDDLPMLDASPVMDEDAAPTGDVDTLPGLEPTHGGWDRPDAPETADDLPLLRNSGERVDSDAPGTDDPDDETDSDPLPGLLVDDRATPDDTKGAERSGDDLVSVAIDHGWQDGAELPTLTDDLPTGTESTDGDVNAIREGDSDEIEPNADASVLDSADPWSRSAQTDSAAEDAPTPPEDQPDLLPGAEDGFADAEAGASPSDTTDSLDTDLEDGGAEVGSSIDHPASEQEPRADPDLLAADILALTPKEVPDTDEAATHYDLAVAFNGMGLLDEAIAHLGTALAEGYDPVATLEVLGEILFGRGQYAEAVSLLQRVLSPATGPARERVALHYWVARSFEQMNESDQAVQHYEHVLEVDSGFRDASDRVERIRSAAF